MNLPPKAINALADIKKELLSRQEGKKEPILDLESVMITLPQPLKRQKPLQSHTRMRHARHPNAYQRWKQHRENW